MGQFHFGFCFFLSSQNEKKRTLGQLFNNRRKTTRFWLSIQTRTSQKSQQIINGHSVDILYTLPWPAVCLWIFIFAIILPKSRFTSGISIFFNLSGWTKVFFIVQEKWLYILYIYFTKHNSMQGRNEKPPWWFETTGSFTTFPANAMCTANANFE